MTRIDWDNAALEQLQHSEAMTDMLDQVGRTIRDTARRNAAGYYQSSRRLQAIISQTGDDTQSAFADVGYEASDPGFVLWFSEVGTSKMSPRPHLRAAVDSTRI